MRKVGHWIRTDLRWAIYLRDDFTCAWCGERVPAARPGDLTLDHLFPGDNRPRRLVTACVTCNSGRRGQTVAASTRRWPGSAARILVRRGRPLDRAAGAAAWAEARRRPPTALPDLPDYVEGASVDSRGFIW